MTPDQRDLLGLAVLHLNTTRCPGGRLVTQGYVCAHCGHDYTDDGKCKKPRRPARNPLRHQPEGDAA